MGRPKQIGYFSHALLLLPFLQELFSSAMQAGPLNQKGQFVILTRCLSGLSIALPCFSDRLGVNQGCQDITSQSTSTDVMIYT